MLLEASINTDSITMQIDNPFTPDLQHMLKTIAQFASSKGISIEGYDLRNLIPKMIRGIAGCEGGCPANAKQLVQQGFGDVALQYIEGGILFARIQIGNGSFFDLKVFPDFS
ncbi:MAG: hypothetical protein ABSA46_06795 [Thermodesulfovibrionales bacterium]